MKLRKSIIFLLTVSMIFSTIIGVTFNVGAADYTVTYTVGENTVLTGSTAGEKVSVYSDEYLEVKAQLYTTDTSISAVQHGGKWCFGAYISSRKNLVPGASGHATFEFTPKVSGIIKINGVIKTSNSNEARFSYTVKSKDSYDNKIVGTNEAQYVDISGSFNVEKDTVYTLIQRNSQAGGIYSFEFQYACSAALDVSGLTNATANINKSKISFNNGTAEADPSAADDQAVVTITPTANYKFVTPPSVTATNATVGDLSKDTNGVYTAPITNFTDDATITVSGEAKEIFTATKATAESISVDLGTELDDVKAQLAGKVTVKSENEVKTESGYTVTDWQCANYSKDIPGTYTFTGTVPASSDRAANIPNAISVTATVTLNKITASLPMIITDFNNIVGIEATTMSCADLIALLPTKAALISGNYSDNNADVVWTNDGTTLDCSAEGNTATINGTLTPSADGVFTGSIGVSATITVSGKTKVNISGIDVGGRAYNKLPIQINGTVVCTASGADVTSGCGALVYDWCDAIGQPLTPNSAPANAGSYMLKVSVAASNADYIGSTKIPFEITKKQITVKPSDCSVNIYETAPSFSLDISGFEAGDVTLLNEEFKLYTSVGAEISGADAVKTLGTYKINWTNSSDPGILVYDAANYDVTISDGAFTVKNNVYSTITPPSGLGGGGGGGTVKPAAPVTPSVTEGAEVKTSVSGSAMTVTKLNTDKMSSGEKNITIDVAAADEKNAINQIKLNTEDAKAVDSLEIVLATGTISASADALNSIATQGSGKQLTMQFSQADEKKLSSKQNTAAEELSADGVYSVSVKNGTKVVSDISGVEISVLLEPAEGKLAAATDVWLLSEDGTMEKIDAEYSKKDKAIIFNAPESGVYAVKSADEKDAIVLTIDKTDVSVFGDKQKIDAAPKIVNDRTMLPIRFIAEELKAAVEWNGDMQTVTIKTGDTDISLVIGEAYATVNGEKSELDSPSFIENNRTYLPVRFVLENLGADVYWDNDLRQVIVVK